MSRVRSAFLCFIFFGTWFLSQGYADSAFFRTMAFHTPCLVRTTRSLLTPPVLGSLITERVNAVYLPKVASVSKYC